MKSFGSELFTYRGSSEAFLNPSFIQPFKAFFMMLSHSTCGMSQTAVYEQPFVAPVLICSKDAGIKFTTSVCLRENSYLIRSKITYIVFVLFNYMKLCVKKDEQIIIFVSIYCKVPQLFWNHVS